MSASKKHRRSDGAPGAHRGPKRANDTTVYFILAMIGGFIALFSVPVLGSTRYWMAVLVGYFAVLAWFTVLAAWKLYRGAEVAGWQQSLARIPLRFAGFGVRKGKPVEAAHDQPAAKQVILISACITLVILVIAFALVLPPLLDAA